MKVKISPREAKLLFGLTFLAIVAIVIGFACQSRLAFQDKTGSGVPSTIANNGGGGGNPPPPPSAGGDFSIVVLPDTQYYSAAYPFAFMDQVNWIVSQRNALNIQFVLGLGDIVDGGGPNPSKACATAAPANYATQWQNAVNAINVLDNAGIPYMLPPGNHDYDCEADRPQPRSLSNYNAHFGPARYANKPWFNGGRLDPASNANFYNTFTINGQQYLVLSLEFFPRTSVMNWANQILSANQDKLAIIITHAYLNYDGNGPGTAHPLQTGDSDSASSYKLAPSCPEVNPPSTCGNGNNGIDLWNNVIKNHSNVFMVLSGHIRLPGAEDMVATAPANNGVGRVDCAVQPGTPVCSGPYHPLQMLSDYQGQGKNGYFGNGYLRVLTFRPSARRLDVTTYSPGIAMEPAKFAAGLPQYKTDPYNQFSMSY